MQPTGEEDLDLLLSLNEDRVPESPGASPSNTHGSGLPDYTPDDVSPKRPRLSGGMSVFREAIKDYLGVEPGTTELKVLPNNAKKERPSGDMVVEKFSGIRIRNQLVASTELNSRFLDTRFVRLDAIRNCLMGDALSGCWATVGVLVEKGSPRMSTSGKNYSVFKMSCLDETSVSVFLFGDAYATNAKEPSGAVFAIFNSSVRNDAMGNGFSLSVYSASQLLKLGTSADFSICKGKRKGGMACTMAINKCKGMYCKYHISNDSKKYTTGRVELQGGNFRSRFRPQSEGIYMVDPHSTSSNKAKLGQKVNVLSVDELKKVLSNADKVTSRGHSQGKRFLMQVTADADRKAASNGSVTNGKTSICPRKRSLETGKAEPNVAAKSFQSGAERKIARRSSENTIDSACSAQMNIFNNDR